jgi:phenylacetate-coenzyme A ligase PaaK-like adenylate-forming protein
MTENYFDWPVYGVNQSTKTSLLSQALSDLTDHHFENCEQYRRILLAQQHQRGSYANLEQVPFLPVRLFKEHELRSVPKEEVFKVLTSSGTTSQKVSRVVLDRDTAKAQTKALVLILQQFLGKDRLPMLILDHPGVIKDRTSFSARGAGILGLSNFGRDHTYALRDEDMSPDVERIQAFIDRNRGRRIFIFGFTFMVWKYFFQALKDLPNAPVFEDAVLIHSGGWKKLLDEAVDNQAFKDALRKKFNIQAIHNFYGMVEQVGSVFVECEFGRLHAPAFADILIRDAQDWSVLPAGKKGLIQPLSVLPSSYPGHSLLTEDVGEWTGIDDCPCGRLGRTFVVHGRIAQAELRGCSDTHAANVEQALAGA